MTMMTMIIFSVLTEIMKSDQGNRSDTSTHSMEAMWKFLRESSVKWTQDSIHDNFNKVCFTIKMSLTLQDSSQTPPIPTHHLPPSYYHPKRTIWVHSRTQPPSAIPPIGSHRCRCTSAPAADL